MSDKQPTRTDQSESGIGHIFAFLPPTAMGVATVLLVQNGHPWMAFAMAFFTFAVQIMTALVYPFTPETKAKLVEAFFA